MEAAVKAGEQNIEAMENLIIAGQALDFATFQQNLQILENSLLEMSKFCLDELSKCNSKFCEMEHAISSAEGTLSLIKDTRLGNIGSWNAFNGFQLDENGDIIAMSNTSLTNGFSQTNGKSGFLKIRAGETHFDEDYFFDYEALTGYKVAHWLYLGNGKVYAENSKGERVVVDGKALCSMNMWGFTPDYFENSHDVFIEFLKENVTELKKEFYIPYAVDYMIKNKLGKTELLSTPSRWFGVTYKADRPGVVAKFQEFADKGIYPSPLYK